MHPAFVDHRHEGEEESPRSLTSRALISRERVRGGGRGERESRADCGTHGGGEAISSFLRESPDYTR